MARYSDEDIQFIAEEQARNLGYDSFAPGTEGAMKIQDIFDAIKRRQQPATVKPHMKPTLNQNPETWQEKTNIEDRINDLKMKSIIKSLSKFIMKAESETGTVSSKPMMPTKPMRGNKPSLLEGPRGPENTSPLSIPLTHPALPTGVGKDYKAIRAVEIKRKHTKGKEGLVPKRITEMVRRSGKVFPRTRIIYVKPDQGEEDKRIVDVYLPEDKFKHKKWPIYAVNKYSHPKGYRRIRNKLIWVNVGDPSDTIRVKDITYEDKEIMILTPEDKKNVVLRAHITLKKPK